MAFFFIKLTPTPKIKEILIKINGPFTKFQQYISISVYKNLPFYFSLSFNDCLNFTELKLNNLFPVYTVSYKHCKL